jgi:hypothetical protein
MLLIEVEFKDRNGHYTVLTLCQEEQGKRVGFYNYKTAEGTELYI